MSEPNRALPELYDAETGEIRPWSDKQVEYANLFIHLPLIADPDEWQGLIARRILASETVEAALEQFETIAAQDVPGRVVTIQDVVLAPSAKKSGCGWYALLGVTFDPLPEGKADPYRDHPDQVLNTGALKLLAQLDVNMRLGKLPWKVKIVATTSGQDASRKVLAFVDPERF